MRHPSAHPHYEAEEESRASSILRERREEERIVDFVLLRRGRVEQPVLGEKHDSGGIVLQCWDGIALESERGQRSRGGAKPRQIKHGIGQRHG